VTTFPKQIVFAQLSWAKFSGNQTEVAKFQISWRSRSFEGHHRFVLPYISTRLRPSPRYPYASRSFNSATVTGITFKSWVSDPQIWILLDCFMN